jgi:hypothetical protein
VTNLVPRQPLRRNHDARPAPENHPKVVELQLEIILTVGPSETARLLGTRHAPGVPRIGDAVELWNGDNLGSFVNGAVVGSVVWCADGTVLVVLDDRSVTPNEARAVIDRMEEDGEWFCV